MLCEKFKNALIELAATGAEPDRDLRAHLDACASCRVTAEQERLLFASIDSGVRQAANTELPPSFLPRFHERLAQESVRRAAMIPGWVLASSAALIVIAAFWIQRVHQPGRSQRRGAQPEVAAERPPSESFGGPRAAASIVASTPQAHPKQHPAKTETEPQLATREPEVLVPPDEREAFAKFLAGLQQRKGVAQALLNPVPDQGSASFPLDPIQIARLEIKPLEGQEQFGSER